MWAKKQQGFTLLEMIIATAMLMGIILAATSMLKSGFDVQDALSTKEKVFHRLSISLKMISRDLESAFIISTKAINKNPAQRTTKSLFKLTTENGFSKIMISGRSHRSRVLASHESDTSFIVYAIAPSEKSSGRTDLVRGETRVLPGSFNEDPQKRIIARNIKSLKVQWWNGDRWVADDFDSTSRDTRDTVPRLVKIDIEAWSEDREDGDGQEDTVDNLSSKMGTVLFIPESQNYKEVKTQFKTIRWNDI